MAGLRATEAAAAVAPDERTDSPTAHLYVKGSSYGDVVVVVVILERYFWRVGGMDEYKREGEARMNLRQVGADVLGHTEGTDPVLAEDLEKKEMKNKKSS